MITNLQMLKYLTPYIEIIAQKSVKVIDKLNQVEEEEGDDDDDVSGIHIEGQYDPDEFKDLDVSAEIRLVNQNYILRIK